LSVYVVKSSALFASLAVIMRQLFILTPLSFATIPVLGQDTRSRPQSRSTESSHLSRNFANTKLVATEIDL
jgi:hypothetical protein